MHDRVSNIRAQCRRLATHLQGYRQKTRGRRGIRGNSAKKNKSKTTRILRRAKLFLEYAGRVGRTNFSPSRLLPVTLTGRDDHPKKSHRRRSTARFHFNSNAATARRASLTRTLY